MSGTGQTILAIVVGGLLLLGMLGLPIYFIRQSMPAERVRGIKFFFLPLRAGFFRPWWSSGFNAAYVERVVDEYARVMPAAYESIGFKVTSEALLEHLARLSCKFRLGPLRSLVREQVGLGDLNRDGKPDSFAGLTLNETHIECGVIESKGMLASGRMRTAFTAFSYEMHNACIMKFASHAVSLAENFISDSETALNHVIGDEKLVDLKAKRRKLDDAFFAIKAE